MIGLPEDIVALLEGPVSVFAASRTADLRPRLARASAVRCAADRATITVYVPREAGAELLEVTGVDAPLAVTVTEVPTHRSVQIKGTIVAIRAATEDERPWIDRQAGGFTDDLGGYGFSLPVVRRLVTWPSTALEVRVAESFVQTPGPGAGQPTRGAP